jgi:hypothetical protein
MGDALSNPRPEGTKPMADQIINVDFHDDTLFAVDRGNGDVFVAITSICRTLGLTPESQRRRIQNDPILRKGHAVLAFPSPGGTQDTVVLRLDLINGWLFGIEARKVRPEARGKLVEYQTECHRVLFDHFYGRTQNTRPDARWVKEMNAASRAVSEIRRSLGARTAAKSLPDIFSKAGINVPGPYTPPQADLPLAGDEADNIVTLHAVD